MKAADQVSESAIRDHLLAFELRQSLLHLITLDMDKRAVVIGSLDKSGQSLIQKWITLGKLAK